MRMIIAVWCVVLLSCTSAVSANNTATTSYMTATAVIPAITTTVNPKKSAFFGFHFHGHVPRTSGYHSSSGYSSANIHQTGNNPRQGYNTNNVGRQGYNTNNVGQGYNTNNAGQGYNTNNVGQGYNTNNAGQGYNTNNVGRQGYNTNNVGQGYNTNNVGQGYNTNNVGQRYNTNNVVHGYNTNNAGHGFNNNHIGSGYNTNNGYNSNNNLNNGYNTRNRGGNGYNLNNVGQGGYSILGGGMTGYNNQHGGNFANQGNTYNINPYMGNDANRFCPNQTLYDSTYMWSANPVGYPVVDINAELINRPELANCLLRTNTPHSSPMLPAVDPTLGHVKSTCNKTTERLYSYFSTNTNNAGKCWFLQEFQEPVFFVTCLHRLCRFCKQVFKSDFETRCIKTHRYVGIYAYCENNAINSRIIYERIIIPDNCVCEAVYCYRNWHK